MRVIPAMVVDLFGLGAALLGFWVVVRFPSFGPRSMWSAMLLTGLTLCLLSPLPAVAGNVAAAAGAPTALLFVVLPALTVLFWSMGCLIRALVTLFVPGRR